jgi:hypothetical protein
MQAGLRIKEDKCEEQKFFSTFFFRFQRAGGGGGQGNQSRVLSSLNWWVEKETGRLFLL